MTGLEQKEDGTVVVRFSELPDLCVACEMKYGRPACEDCRNV